MKIASAVFAALIAASCALASRAAAAVLVRTHAARTVPASAAATPVTAAGTTILPASTLSLAPAAGPSLSALTAAAPVAIPAKASERAAALPAAAASVANQKALAVLAAPDASNDRTGQAEKAAASGEAFDGSTNSVDTPGQVLPGAATATGLGAGVSLPSLSASATGKQGTAKPSGILGKNQLLALQKELNLVEDAKGRLVSGDIKADAFLGPYMTLHGHLLSALESIGVKARSIDRYDYKSWPVPTMYWNESREQQISAMELTIGPELAKALQAPTIEILPVEDGAWVNRLAYHLAQRSKTRVILDVASADSAGAALFASRANYFNLPLSVVGSDAADFQTAHEIRHWARTTILADFPTIFALNVAPTFGGTLPAGPPYEHGFQIDELRAYAYGVSQELSLFEKPSHEERPILIHAANGWKVLPAAVHGQHALEISRDPTVKLKIIGQLVETNDGFLKSVAAAAKSRNMSPPSSVKAIEFLGEIVLAPTTRDSNAALSISLGTEGGDEPMVFLSFEKEAVSFRMPPNKELSAKLPRLRALTSAKPLSADAQREAAEFLGAAQTDVLHLLERLGEFASRFGPLNDELKRAHGASDVAGATSVVRRMVALIKDYERKP